MYCMYRQTSPSPSGTIFADYFNNGKLARNSRVETVGQHKTNRYGCQQATYISYRNLLCPLYSSVKSIIPHLLQDLILPSFNFGQSLNRSLSFFHFLYFIALSSPLLPSVTREAKARTAPRWPSTITNYWIKRLHLLRSIMSDIYSISSGFESRSWDWLIFVSPHRKICHIFF